MPRPAKGTRLHRYKHSPNWYVLSTGCARRSTGTPCLGLAMARMGKTADFMQIQEIDPIISSEEMEAAARKIVRKSRERAKLKGIDFDMSTQSVLSMIAEQSRRCAVTGIEFSNAPSSRGRRIPFAPSADRIDNARGYTMDNIRIVCAIANLARGDFSDAEFLKMCRGASIRCRDDV